MFAPVGDAEAVRAALHAAGAGHVGDYDTVSYTVAGEGRFRPLAGAHPAVGEVGRLEVTDELRIEALVPRHRRTEVVRAVLAAHSYEEVAYDVIELGDPGTAATGMGRIGDVDETTLGCVRRAGRRGAAADGARRAGRVATPTASYAGWP